MQTDQKLWQSLILGEAKALETIYALHIKELHRYGMYFSLDESQITDSLHDIFVELWQKRAQLTPDVSNIRSYLIKTLRNRLLRVLENQKKTVLTNDISTYLFDFQGAHDLLLIQDEENAQRTTQLNTAIQTLSSRQREALFLRFYQNLSYEEVATIMNLEQQSAYNLIFRGVEGLRKYFR
ncbi:MAG: hypothetical protein RLZZ292_719 [Bacteroidota bacterium]|jgi:RNA polymerase sigma factor (sigma-70 family)